MTDYSVFIFQAKDSDEMAVYKEFPTHVTAWSYMFGAIAMIITAGAKYRHAAAAAALRTINCV